MRVFLCGAALLFATALSPATHPARAANRGTAFYVSPDGNDNWSGRLSAPNHGGTDGPFATIARAKDAVRKVNSSSRGPIVVHIELGTYELARPLEFTADDSGASGAPVTYMGDSSSAPVVLSGGRVIKGWQATEGGIWATRVDGVQNGGWFFRQLFVNGQRRPRASAPQTGYFNMSGPLSGGDQPQLRAQGGQIPSQINSAEADVIALDKWMDFRASIIAQDGDSLTLSRPHTPLFNHPDVRYRIENVRSGLSLAGSWYLSRNDGMLYYHPLPGETPTSLRAVAPALPQLLLLNGSPSEPVQNLSFEGLTFSYAQWPMPDASIFGHQADADLGAAIEARGAHNVSFTRCVFAHLGSFAIAFGRGSKSVQFLSNEMADLGAGAIKIGESNGDVHTLRSRGERGNRRRRNFGGFGRGRQGNFSDQGQGEISDSPGNVRQGPDYPTSDEDTSSGNLISGNRIHDFGVVFPGAVGIWIGQSYGNTISHNEIFDGYYSAISVGWTWGYGPSAAHDNIVEYNRIHDIGRSLMCDLGGIYFLGVQPGSVIRNNVIYNITRYDGQFGYGAWGIYLDGTASRVVITDNLVYRTEDGAFRQSSGELNTFTNNIFAFGQNAQIRRQQGAAQSSFDFTHNIVYWTQGAFFVTPAGEGSYHFDYNLYYSKDGNIEIASPHGPRIDFSEWQQQGQDEHSIVADPLFVNAAGGDFALRPNSPASRIGFKPFDYSQAGLAGSPR